VTERPHRFILQAYHPEYACPAFETMFTVERLGELQMLLGLDAQDDPQLDQKIYHLDAADIEAIRQRFNVAFEAGEREVVLFKADEPGKDIPYLSHTGYELLLMLDGRKKLANMYFEYPPHRHPHEDQFDRFVSEGLLHKEVDVEAFDKPIRSITGKIFDGLRTAYYTPKGEEWRIQAFRLIRKTKGGWNDTLERLEGMLYGYEDWQSDWWAENRRRMLLQYGTLLVYAALTSSELAAVEHSGFRALPALDRSLPVIISFDLAEEERRQLGSALVRFRVKALPFLNLVTNPRERGHVLRADQIKDLNGVLLEKIEVVTAAQ
jgi:hypothetical protein